MTMYYYGLRYPAVSDVVEISSTFTSCIISDAYKLMHH